MKKKLITVTVFCLLIAVSSCKKNCFCEVKYEDQVLQGYEKVWVSYEKEKECPNFKDEAWDMLGYAYTCTVE